MIEPKKYNTFIAALKKLIKKLQKKVERSEIPPRLEMENRTKNRRKKT
jgi:hypothetical protein